MFLKIFLGFMSFSHWIVDKLNTKLAFLIFSNLLGVSWVYVVYNVLDEKYHLTPEPIHNV